MISSQGHQLWPVAHRRDGLATAQLLQGLGHLLLRDVIVHGGNRDIAAVDNLGPIQVWVDVCPRIEGSEGGLARRRLADGPRTKAGAGTVGDGRIKGSTDNSDVEGLGGLGEAFDMVEVSKCANAGETPLSG